MDISEIYHNWSFWFGFRPMGGMAVEGFYGGATPAESDHLPPGDVPEEHTKYVERQYYRAWRKAVPSSGNVKPAYSAVSYKETGSPGRAVAGTDRRSALVSRRPPEVERLIRAFWLHRSAVK